MGHSTTVHTPSTKGTISVGRRRSDDDIVSELRVYLRWAPALSNATRPPAAAAARPFHAGPTQQASVSQAKEGAPPPNPASGGRRTRHPGDGLLSPRINNNEKTRTHHGMYIDSSSRLCCTRCLYLRGGVGGSSPSSTQNDRDSLPQAAPAAVRPAVVGGHTL